MECDERAEQRKRAGQCADCEFARLVNSAKGGEFWRCARADDDEAYLRYPPLPVRDCRGFRAR